MLEFLEDIIKLFTNVEEDHPLQAHHWIIGVMVMGLISVVVFYFLNN